MATINANTTHATLDAAKAAAAENTSKRKKIAYRCELAGQEVFVVATTANKARAYASRHFGLNVSPAEQADRKPPRRKTIVEQLQAMTAEERTALLATLDGQPSDGEAPPKARKQSRKGK